MALPTGTVTLLFTDVEGSTRLWEESPGAMRLALARHDVLLRGCIERRGGAVFKTVGDAFCAAFATAPDALEAALSAQIAFQSEPWPDGISLKVRMALHTGAVELRDDDYFGQPLNRTARLLAIGHGDQTLLSQAACELTRDSLPRDVSLRRMGCHRLKDLSRPENVYQLLHPVLPGDFPQLRSLDNPDLKHNLPLQMTSFVGREREIAEIGALLGRTRLLTLTGSGGCGKTRLALQVGAEMIEHKTGGVWFVELAAVSDPKLVPQTVASVLGIREEPGEPIAQTLTENLRNKQLLLILDNCEHLLDASAQLAETTLRHCPNVQILATGREKLGVGGEQTYPVPSLTVPATTQSDTIESVTQYEAVRLFVERAMLVRPEFEVTNRTAPALAQICVHLDGIPLAIELAAARVGTLSVEEINAHLGDRFRLLTKGSRAAWPRQRTLRAAADWSFGLLTEGEKQLLSRVSVFPGGWTLEAATAACSGLPIEAGDVLDTLTSLVDKSLVVFKEEKEGEGRYRLLETIRQYGQERLDEFTDPWIWRKRHLDWCLALTGGAEKNLTGPDQASWYERLETEHENLREALRFSGGQSASAPTMQAQPDSDACLQLAASLWRFWVVRGYLTEGRDWCSIAFSAEKEQRRTRLRAKALNGAGALAYRQSDYTSSRSFYEESLSIWRDLQDRKGISAALNNLGLVAQEQGDYGAARAFQEDGLAIQKEIGDRWGSAISLNNLGILARDQGEHATARALHEESLSICRELGDKQGIAVALTNLGNVAYCQGDYGAARAFHEESLSIYRDVGARHGIASSLNNLGLVGLEQGDLTYAQKRLEESLSISDEIGVRQGIADASNNLSLVAAQKGDWDEARTHISRSARIVQELRDKWRAAQVAEIWGTFDKAHCRWERATRLWAAAARMRIELGVPRPPKDMDEHERELGRAREALGEAGFAEAWGAGQKLSMEEALAFALEHGSPSKGRTRVP